MATQNIARSCSKLTTHTPASAARAFLQLSSRRYLHSTPLPVLDFLLPNVATRAITQRWVVRSTNGLQAQSKRTFTSSARRLETTAIHNARNDDEGNPMQIEITPRASNRLREIMEKDGNPNLALRIQVESGGCYGFQYLMSLTTLPSDLSATSIREQSRPEIKISSMNPSEVPSRCTKTHDHPHDHTHDHKIPEEASPALNTSSNDPNAMPSIKPGGSPFPEDESKKVEVENTNNLDEDDTVFGTEGAAGPKIVMDASSLDLLKGSKIDYTMELIGSQFKIVDNPLATSSCGCGTSFDIKA